MKKTKKNYITLNTTNKVNAGVIAQYQRELLKLVQQMISTYTKELLGMYKSNKEEIRQIAQDESIAEQYKKKMEQLNQAYQQYFAKYGQQKAESMVKQTAAIQQRSFIKEYAKLMFVLMNTNQVRPEDKVFVEFMKTQFAPQNFMPTKAGKEAFMKAFTLNTKAYSEVAETIKQTTITNNVELIKSIHQQYHREVSQALYDSIINGKPTKSIVELLKQAGAKTKRRARLIARDQVHKIHETLHLQELKQVGITKAKWIHLGGGKTDRKTHVTKAPEGLNGGIFDISKGIYDPAVNKYIKPAELPFCRCTAVAIVEI